MEELGVVGFIIIILTAIVSYNGFKNSDFFERYLFHTGGILKKKEYVRLVSSGFLHANWTHFAFNMITLYFFSASLEISLGLLTFTFLYFVSLLGGNFFAIYIHRRNLSYRAIGASGAVAGVVFAAIAKFPELSIGIPFTPIHFPGWIYGLLYMAYTIWGIKSQVGKIGHEAHFGGALTGLLFIIILYPEVIWTNYLPILAIAIPTVLFLFYLLGNRSASVISLGSRASKKSDNLTFEDRHNTIRQDKQAEIDGLLEKIKIKGYSKLSDKDKKRLKDLTD